MIKLSKISKDYQLSKEKISVLKEISLEIKKGEFVALMGPSGSGKSTLLGIISGIDTVSDGVVEINGEDVSKKNESQMARFRSDHIGIVFQAFNLIPSLTALQNVQTPLFAHSSKEKHSDIKKKGIEMLTKVGLEKRGNHKPSELSGGEQQRVAIARALITSPEILVADEPTGNLDSATGNKILDLFKQLHKELNLTLIVATHSEEIAKEADRIIKIKDGAII